MPLATLQLPKDGMNKKAIALQGRGETTGKEPNLTVSTVPTSFPQCLSATI